MNERKNLPIKNTIPCNTVFRNECFSQNWSNFVSRSALKEVLCRSSSNGIETILNSNVKPYENINLSGNIKIQSKIHSIVRLQWWCTNYP